MKFNWGHYILFTFLAFVALILSMVYFSFKQENELVADDYYKRELDYQSVIDRRENSKGLKKSVNWECSNGQILLDFPDLGSKPAGTISLLRPSDKSKDLFFEIKTDKALKQFLMSKSFVNGKYLITVEWSVNDVYYFDEGPIFITL